MAEAKFDVLATNIVDGNGMPANTKADKVVDVQGVKVAFFGLTTEDTPIASSPGDIKFSSTINTARSKAKELREKGADIVVAIAHTPLDVDMILARSSGVDVIIGGHDEHLLAFYDGKVAHRIGVAGQLHRHYRSGRHQGAERRQDDGDLDAELPHHRQRHGENPIRRSRRW